MERPGLLLALAGSYLVGSIPTAYLLVKRLKRVDVRTVGSGNVGATNVTRAAGLGAGTAVFVLDLAKGLVAVWGLAPWLIRPVTPAVQLACGLAAVVGHVFPVFLGFRGGKGVATTIGVLIGTVPLIAAMCLAVWAGCFLVWRYVSVGSLATAVTLPLIQTLVHRPLPEILLGAALAGVIIARHRTNIIRLLHGTEHRAGRPRRGA
jgi:glycerol-3-phosphate acyltransferase PlsY